MRFKLVSDSLGQGFFVHRIITEKSNLLFNIKWKLLPLDRVLDWIWMQSITSEMYSRGGLFSRTRFLSLLLNPSLWIRVWKLMIQRCHSSFFFLLWLAFFVIKWLQICLGELDVNYLRHLSTPGVLIFWSVDGIYIKKRLMDALSFTCTYERKWVSVSHSLSFGRSGQGFALDSASQLIYVFGGARAGYDFNDIARFDIRGENWVALHSRNRPPQGRQKHSVAFFNGTLIVFGGRKSNGEILGDLWQFDIQTSLWKSLPVPSRIVPRYGHSATVIGGEMIIFGGVVRTHSKSLPLQATSELATFSFATREWAVEHPINTSHGMPSQRHSHAAAAIMSDLYIIGGAGSADLEKAQGSLWKYSVDTKTWILLSGASVNDPEILGRYDAAACVHNDGNILFAGGQTDSMVRDDVYSLWVGERLPVKALSPFYLVSPTSM